MMKNARRLGIAAVVGLIALLPGSAGAASFTDVEYARPDGAALLLDLEMPEGAGPYPVVVFVHGGNFTGGDRKGTSKGLIAALKEAGIGWASVDYRLAPKYHFPVLTDDITTALRFLRVHASTYHLDPKRLALMGESAGTLLVSYLGAVARGEDRVAAVVGISGSHDLRRRLYPTGGCLASGKFVPNPIPGTPQFCLPEGIAAYINVTAPGTDTDAAIRAASPRDHIRKEMPPFLLLHGTADVMAPFEQSVLMFEAMRAAGARCDLDAIDGGGHGMGSWDAQPAQAGYRARMVDWLKAVFK